MSYQRPTADAVDFSVESHEPPAADTVDFGVEQLVMVAPDPVALDLALPEPFAAPVKTIVAPEAVSLELSTPDAAIRPGVLIEPQPVELDLRTPTTAAIQPFLLNEEWQLDRQRLTPSSDIEATPQTTTLTFEAARSEIETWRQFDAAGDQTVEEGFGGAFRAIDRGGRGAVGARASLQDVRPFKPQQRYLIADYSESQLAADRFEISLTLQRVTNRQQAFPTVDESGDWEIEAGDSTIGLEAGQVGRIDSDGESGGRRVTLPLLVSDKQAAALLDALGYPAGVVKRAVPDGPDQLFDETDGDQTIVLDVPGAASIDSGAWLVTGWSLSWHSHDGGDRWRFEMELGGS